MLLTAKWVLPIIGNAIEDGAVLIKGDAIVDIGKSAELKEKHPQAKMKDMGNAVLLPGFVDLHTHLEYSVFRGVCDDLSFAKWKIQLADRAKRMQDGDWRLSADLGALEVIQSGITTVADISNKNAGLDSLLTAGLRGRIYYEITGMDRDQIQNIISRSHENVVKWQELTDGTIVDIGLSPYSPYTVAPLLYQATGKWARDEGLAVCTHLAGSREEYDFIKYGSSLLAGRYRELMGWQDLLWQPTGVSPVKYLEQWDVFDSDIMVIHSVHVDRNDLEILEKYDVAIAHCPKCNAKLGMGIAPLNNISRRNLRLGLGTDSPASSNTMDIFDEMRIALMLQRGSTESAEGSSADYFVELATIGGAQALRMDNLIGSLEIGKKADIIAVDLSYSHQPVTYDPYSALVYSANQEDVTMTMINGRIVYENDKFITLDEEAIVKSCGPVRERLFAPDK